MPYRPMQVVQIGRAQRDGPSAAQQAQQAAMEELQASLSSTRARIQQMIADGADRTTAGRNELAHAREELATTAMQIRSLEAMQQEDAIGQAARNIAQAAMQNRRTTSTTAPPAAPDIPDIPPRVQDVSMMFILALAATIILTPLMRALGRILERRAAPPQRLPPEIAGQLTRMEQAIETVAVEVERISEGQRFATRLLAERDKVGNLRS